MDLFPLREIGPYTLVSASEGGVRIWVPTSPEDDFNPPKIEVNGHCATYERGGWKSTDNGGIPSSYDLDELLHQAITVVDVYIERLGIR